MRRFLVFSLLVIFSTNCGLQNFISMGHVVAAGESMSPTIKQGDHFVYAGFKTTETELLQRFDIIVFKAQAGNGSQITEDTKYVFRVIGLEGEKIQLQKGKLFINDTLVDEPFEKVESKDNFEPVIVPKGEYFVLGDNRPESFDSRLWKYKTVKRSDVLGVVNNIIRKKDYDNGKRW